MPDFSYKAVDPTGKTIRGTRFAADLAELEYRLRQSNLNLVSATPVGENPLAKALQRLRVGTVNRRELIEFTNNLRVMLKAGVPLVQALTELREDQENGYFKGAIENLIEEVQSGKSLYDAMVRWKRIFPELYCNVVDIGENTGRLDEVLFELMHHYQRIEDLNKNVRKALIYPAFVLATVVLVSIVFLGKVFPILFSMFKEFDIQEYPKITEVFISLSNAVRYNWAFIIVGLASVVLLFLLLRRIQVTRYYLDWLQINLPFVKTFFIQLHMAFFARYLATLQKSGVNIIKSMELAAASVHNLVLRRKLLLAKVDVLEGSLLSQTLRADRFIPNMVIRMIAIGEAAGTLPEQLDYVAHYYDELLDRRITVALALLEPILIVLMAGLGLALVMAVLMPMYSMMGQLFQSYSGSTSF